MRTLVVATILGAAACQVHAQWELVTADGDGKAFLIDKTRVTRAAASMRRAWVKVDAQFVAAPNPISHVMAIYEADCGSRTLLQAQWVAYGKDGRVADESGPVSAGHQPVAPESVGEKLFVFICGLDGSTLRRGQP